MAEMKTLLAAIYREYSTALIHGKEGICPAINSRFEMVYDYGFQGAPVRML